MKALTFVIGVAAGMAVASAAISSMYPDVPRRVSRDSKRMVRMGRRAFCQMFS